MATSPPAEGYRNPVLPGFHPDPSICRWDDGYLLVTSSFTWCPGVPLFRSTDLVNWVRLGHVLDRTSQLDLSITQGWTSLGVYAPTLRAHDDRLWMITTNVTTTGRHTFFVTTDDPAAPWSDPVDVDVIGIDPDLCWDDAGHCWVHFSGGPSGIARCRIDDMTGKVLEGPEPTWSGTGLQYPEAPHLFRRDDTWYLLIAEGGTHTGHAVSIARGPSPTGPWEGCPANPIVSHRSMNRPIRNTGHADVVEAPDGSWWMVLLGVRPRGIDDGFHVLGRETFLAPVEWVDGWPVVAAVELEVGSHPPIPAIDVAVRDDFDRSDLDPRWIALRRAPSEVASLDVRPGWLTIHGSDADLGSDEPALVGRRQQHHHCRVRALVDPGSATEAGLTVYLDTGGHYDVVVLGGQVVARAVAGPFDDVRAEVPVPPGPVVLTLETTSHAQGPDTIVLGFEDAEGKSHVLAELDGRFVSTEVVGGFLGRIIAMVAVGGDAAFDWFEYAPT